MPRKLSLFAVTNAILFSLFTLFIGFLLYTMFTDRTPPAHSQRWGTVTITHCSGGGRIGRMCFGNFSNTDHTIQLRDVHVMNDSSASPGDTAHVYKDSQENYVVKTGGEATLNNSIGLLFIASLWIPWAVALVIGIRRRYAARRS